MKKDKSKTNQILNYITNTLTYLGHILCSDMDKKNKPQKAVVYSVLNTTQSILNSVNHGFRGLIALIKLLQQSFIKKKKHTKMYYW